MTRRVAAASASRQAVPAHGEPAQESLRLLVVTSRPAVQAFFSGLGERILRPLAITHLPPDPGTVTGHYEEIERATAAVVDVGVEPATAVQVCRDLHERRKDLPIVAVACCPRSLTVWNLRAMIAAGVNAVLDLQATPDETLRAVESVVRGGSILQLHGGYGALLRDVLSRRAPKVETHARLLDLIARGLPDREIGRRLHLSPHTVKHHIESLRDQVGVRNRVELAAWAGRHGFYSPDDA